MFHLRESPGIWRPLAKGALVILSGRGEDRRARAPALSLWVSLEPANWAEVEKWAGTNANRWQVSSQAEVTESGCSVRTASIEPI